MFTKFMKKARSQRGAMFGLDARIALAIFGGLSVVAGAAVVSSLRETDVTSLTTEFDNISKGYINYTFDTGVDVPLGTDPGQGFAALYENTSPETLGWKGPYLTMSSNINARFGGTYGIFQDDIDGSWGGASIPNADSEGCSSICGAWLRLDTVPCEIVASIDQRIDHSDGESAGNVRYESCDSGSNTVVAYFLSRQMPK